MVLGLILAALLDFSHGEYSFKIEGPTNEIDLGKSLFFDSTFVAPENSPLPDLRTRARGFQLVEAIDDEPRYEADGRVRIVTHWRLLPKPCEDVYKIAPFTVGDEVAGPLYFTVKKPEPAYGDMEIDPKKVMPPLSWALVAKVLLAIISFVTLFAVVFFGIKHLHLKIKEFKMSPIERAYAELDELLRKNLPGRGKFKDFYVELTRLVRRYIQRKYGVRAPHLTTEEFLRDFKDGPKESLEALREFMESSDMVKFAGIEATSEMTNDATGKARGYLDGDDAFTKAAAKKENSK